MKKRLAIAMLLLCGFTYSFAQGDQEQLAQPSSYADGKINELTAQLNKCRAIYKGKVATSKAQLEEAKKKNVLSVPELSKKLQEEIDSQARVCKEIKANIEDIQKNQSLFLSIENAAPSEEIGPTVRCFRLGQNWKEFSQCATSLGLKPSIRIDQNFMTSIPTSPMDSKDFGSVLIALAVSRVSIKAFEDMQQLFLAKLKVFCAGPVWAMLDNQNTVQMLYIGNPQFFGTSTFDKNFLDAFMKSYKIEYLDPVFIDLPPDGGQYYKYEGDGWLVKLSNENLGRFVAFLKTGSQKRNYTF
ncbi:MAG: hypothetical protein LUC43_01815 [Burkholderiales bacterium]|nr:hypothetical protein [Burkholderiales bacterium]